MALRAAKASGETLTLEGLFAEQHRVSTCRFSKKQRSGLLAALSPMLQVDITLS
jgi:hypothetical protein